MKPEFVFGLEGARWPVLVVNADGAVLMSNPAAQTIFGDLLRGDPARLEAIWATGNSGTAADFAALWEAQPDEATELKFRTESGKARSFSTMIAQLEQGGETWYVMQLLPPPGKLAATAGELEPVADTKDLPTGDAALKQKLDCVLQLARTVSLDFNNALTGVLAHTSLLLGKAEPEHPWRRSLVEVEKAAARAAEIASELALFSQQEKKSRRVPAGNLNLVVARCVDIFKSAHGARFAWPLALERGLFAARFDEAKVHQALTKILENAVEAFGGSGTGQISVRTRNMELTEPTQDRNVRLAAGNYVCIEIMDNGPGIEIEALPRVFEPFFTTKRAPHRGLGLALVYGMITNHAGGVAISSQVGNGTSVRVYLPAETTFVKESMGGDKDLRGAGTILVVDDENLMLTMAETILGEFGYQVLTANSGQKALQILAQPKQQLDLMITDLVMPGMDGRALIESLRKMEPDLPVICMSGYVMPEDQLAGSGCLQKPFTTTELLLKVKAALTTGKAVD